MKHFKLLLLVIAFLGIKLPSFSQGFTPPADSNAVVYFVRVSNFGGAISFEYFDNEKFVGIFKGKNYMRYECPAGKHLLWASSENKEFLDCDLKAGEIYLVLVNIEMGMWKARVELEPLTVDNKDFERAKALVLKQAPIETSEDKIKSTQEKLTERGFVENIMKLYEEKWKHDECTKKLNSEYAIPREKLN
ncbi:hypothetical protein [Alistipes sp. ZOR0009]|uniref:hypothetical protein n=1 Tax=Alistipes sp. ZOR0009 TaxID=1339253 RepID=UPI000645B054|nr:hypothetical protein [Alistipes sp. ZOR0009]